jgi:hypothetical protein
VHDLAERPPPGVADRRQRPVSRIAERNKQGPVAVLGETQQLAVLIISEFCANAVLHSDSRGQFVIARTELFPTLLRVEVEDLGGKWAAGDPDGTHPHGLMIVEALTGMGEWGIDGDEAGRVAWARLGT